jgi:hypothetical protein
MDTCVQWTIEPFKGLGAVDKWFGRYRKLVGEVFLHLLLDLITLGFLSIPIDENPED